MLSVVASDVECQDACCIVVVEDGAHTLSYVNVVVQPRAPFNIYILTQ